MRTVGLIEPKGKLAKSGDGKNTAPKGKPAKSGEEAPKSQGEANE